MDSISKFSKKTLFNTKILSKADELELGRKIKEEGCLKSEEILIVNNTRLVYSIAKRFKKVGNYSHDLNDFVSVGFEGLIIAAGKYDYTKNKKFSTYATAWIQQRIMKFISDNKNDIRIPYKTRLIVSKIRKAIQELEQDGINMPSIEIIASKAGVTKREVKKNQSLINMCVVSFQNDTNNPNVTEGSNVGGGNIPDTMMTPLEQHQMEEVIDYIDTYLQDNYSEQENYIFRHYSGFKCTNMNLRELSEVIGVTKERIRQIYQKLANEIKKEIEKVA